jgi:hypothetical protein
MNQLMENKEEHRGDETSLYGSDKVTQEQPASSIKGQIDEQNEGRR